jgi:hypothetical protein
MELNKRTKVSFWELYQKGGTNEALEGKCDNTRYLSRTC